MHVLRYFVMADTFYCGCTVQIRTSTVQVYYGRSTDVVGAVVQYEYSNTARRYILVRKRFCFTGHEGEKIWSVSLLQYEKVVVSVLLIFFVTNS